MSRDALSDVLIRAAASADLDATDAVPLRTGAHATFSLRKEIVARIGAPGSLPVAERELRISAWLNASGVPAVEPVPVRQPVVIDDRPVTWWKFLPDIRPATPAELATALRRLHRSAPPTSFDLPTYEPFADVRQRITSATIIEADDRAWLLRHSETLEQRYARLPSSEQQQVIHGDAWQGNVAVPPSGVPILLDLDRVALGRTEWDLTPIAVDYRDFRRLTDIEYQSFVDAYGGPDPIASDTFDLFARIQELRWTAFAVGLAGHRTDALAEATRRIACLRGLVPKPWAWKAL